MSKSVSDTAVGQWFLSNENNDRFKTNNIPKSVLISLSKLTDEELNRLSEDACWDMYWARFRSNVFNNIENKDKEKTLFGEDEFPNYMKDYQKQFFPNLNDEEELVHTVSIKLRILFDMLIFWACGLVQINNHFDLFDVAEQRALIDSSSSFVKRTRIDKLLIQQETNKESNKIKYLEKYKEKSCRSLIKEALKNNDLEGAKKLIKKYNTIQERMS